MAELMKGKTFHERKHKVTYPCIAEVKYDEIRVHVKYTVDVCGLDDEVEFLSYAGKPLANLGLYSQAFLDFFRESGLTELDMGFEANGNFNDSYRWVRSTKGLPDDLVGKPVKWFLFALPECTLKFAGFDLLENTHIEERARRAHELCLHGLDVEPPSAVVVSDEDALHALFVRRRQQGFEGLMVKSFDHTYQKGKRIDGWLKMKPEAEADGLIVGFTEAVSEDGVPHGRVGSVMLRLEDGSLASPHGIAHDLGKHMWDNPDEYLNKQWVQFKYMERDRQGGYRHPTFVRLREDKA